MKATIFEIKRFAVHDGDGIRTTVFFKGCTLKCIWCHNPEGIGFKPQLAFYANKCIGCGECKRICTRDECITCGKCEEICLGSARKLYGREVTVEELMPQLLEDAEFYENSGGGVTLSGGECLCQADFCAELLHELKKNNIRTAVDTCGYVPRASIEKVMENTDIFLYDLKAIDEDVHIRCTGQPNGLILDNLRYIDSIGKPIEIRIPYVPGYNDDQIEKMAKFLSGLRNITKIRVLPYHNYAGSKYASLTMENTLPDLLPTESEVKNAVEMFKRYGMNAE